MLNKTREYLNEIFDYITIVVGEHNGEILFAGVLK